MKRQKYLFRLRRYSSKARTERGYALLEYCAGAAVLLVIVWGALNLLGDNLSTLLGSIGTWAVDRSIDIANNSS